ncbi:hypothetical protein DY251_20775 [Mesorhizobium denitrificans]|uniref:Uncharacterized protein n=1 Tax=Mesorhizobium denitrificans TaxID=2294114 RepID=A0A371X247_9HYPH|nr:hypothetical protein DY251_20775 [Mesorhizobium denitrificans]
MRTAVHVSLLTGLLGIVSCTNTSTGDWKQAPTGPTSKLEQVKAICKGRAAETQVSAGRLWIAGAVAADASFKGCMAEHGYVQN